MNYSYSFIDNKAHQADQRKKTVRRRRRGASIVKHNKTNKLLGGGGGGDTHPFFSAEGGGTPPPTPPPIVITKTKPIMEYKRFKLLQEYKKAYKPPKQFSKLDIYNIMPRWLMNNTNNNKRDPVLPLNSKTINNNQLIGDIKFNYDRVSATEIKYIIGHLALPEMCKNIWETIHTTQKGEYIIEETSPQGHFVVYKMSATTDDDNAENLTNIVKIPMELHKTIIEKLKALQYTDYQIKEQIYCLLVRYNTLDSSNQQLANNPRFYNYLKSHWGVNFELFASGINCLFDNFCSLYPDLEEPLGSKGNFNRIILHSGFYVANPPFDENIVLNMVKRLLEFLNDHTNGELTFFITIPSDWENFEGLELIKGSPFLTFFRIVPKHKAIYFNYLTNKFIKPCSVAFILLQNQKGKTVHNIQPKFNSIINKFY